MTAALSPGVSLYRAGHRGLVGSRTITFRGIGPPLREFLHVDDPADATRFLLGHFSAPGSINAGSRREMKTGDVAKLLDASRIPKLGWEARTGLRERMVRTCSWRRRRVAEPETAGAAR